MHALSIHTRVRVIIAQKLATTAASTHASGLVWRLGRTLSKGASSSNPASGPGVGGGRRLKHHVEEHTWGQKEKKRRFVFRCFFICPCGSTRLPFDSLSWWLEVFSAAQDPGGNDGSSVAGIANLCTQCDALPRFLCPWFAFRLQNPVSRA